MVQGGYSILPVRLTNVSAFLIHKPGEAILVDSGKGGSEKKILEVMELAGLNPGMLKLLILTHAHFDHAGSAAALKELTGCPLMIHALEGDRLRKGYTPLPPGTRWKAKILVGLGRTVARRMGKYRGVEPDMLAGDSHDLQEFGFPGKVIHTPGHTHGSMVVLMEGGELVAGDTLFGLDGKQHFPPFAEDLPALLESWKLILGLPVSTIYPAHGRTIPFSSFRDEYESAVQRYG